MSEPNRDRRVFFIIDDEGDSQTLDADNPSDALESAKAWLKGCPSVDEVEVFEYGGQGFFTHHWTVRRQKESKVVYV